MGILQNVTKYVYDRAVAFETKFNAAKPLIGSGTYTLNQFFTDTTQFWSDGIDGLGQLFPMLPSDTVPVSFKTVGSTSPSFGDLVNPGFYPSSATLQDTGLIPLTGGAATGGATILTVQTDGTLQIKIPSLSKQKSGEFYQDIVFYLDAASKVHPVVVLVIKVT